MILGATLALVQARRLEGRNGLARPGTEVILAPDPALPPLATNGEADSDDVVTPPLDPPAEPSPVMLDLRREAFDLSAAVRAFADSARTKLGADAFQLKADIEDNVFIDGRPEFVRTILEDLLDPALSAPTAHAALALALRTDAEGGRGHAVLTLDTPRVLETDARGRLSLVKQFIAALGAAATSEARPNGAERVFLRFPLSRTSPAARGAG